MKIRRGELYWADLGKSIGSEQREFRPVLIIQNNKVNKYSHHTIVAVISKIKENKQSQPTHYPLPNHLELKKPSIVMLEQIQTIDQSKLMGYIGKLGPRYMKVIDRRLLISVGLNARKKGGKENGL